jgi:hypothetical protein
MYATVAELASFIKQDVDTSTATLDLQILSELFAKRAHTRFEVTATTYSKPGYGNVELVMPYAPLIAVQAVRVAGVTLTPVTDYTVIEQSLYRRVGFGVPWRFPPDLVEVDYTHGYTTVPDDVKGAVLESAAAAYISPDVTTASETIDDYTVKSTPRTGGVRLSDAAQALADFYAGALAA